MPNEEVMTTGFLMACFAWTLWWNLDWRRFIKFYGVSGPPVSALGRNKFPGFFARCLLGAGDPSRSVLLGVPIRDCRLVRCYRFAS